MDPTPDNNTSQKENQKRGPISQALDLIGGGFKNPLGKIFPKAAGQTALRGFAAFLAANPWVWLVLGIVILVIVVFVIVFSGASGGVPGAPTLEPTPTIGPTQTQIPIASPPAL